MGRPSDWWVLDLDADPTPGDPLRVRELARAFSELSADAFDAAADVRRQAGEGGVTGWLGEAGAVFGEAIGEFPGQLDKLDTSYGMVSRALTTYAGDLEAAQSQADAALVRGREAHGRLQAAQGQVAGAETGEETARTALSTASGVWPLTDVPASWSSAPPPGVDPEQVRLHTDAAGRLSGLRTQVSDAQSDVDAERALAVAAKTLRETAASTCRGEIDRASDAGIRNRGFWDKARDFVSDAWDVLVKLANIVIVVAAIAALILGGPILWTLVVVAAAVVLADTLMKYANGEASLWDVGFALLNFVPGGKALSLGAGLARGASRLRALGGAVRGGWGTVRNMAGGLRGLRTNARTMVSRVFGGDPGDVVTGQVTLTQTDVDLPGLLPLVLERAHHSTYRHGRHFGSTWASTLDQRLEVDAEGACLPLADGTILTYPRPPTDVTPVLPVEGVRWPLAVDPNTGAYTVTDPQTGRALHFPPPAPDPDRTAGQVAVLPLAAVIDRNDHRIDIDRAPDGTPTAVRHSGGYEIAIDTTATGRVEALRLVSGGHEPVALVQFAYDAAGRLAEVTNSSGRPLRFGYDDQDRLTGWTDRNGRWYSYAYDEAGRCIRGTGSGGYLSNLFAYLPEARTTVVTNSLGHRRTYTHNELGQVVRMTDPLGNSVMSAWSRYDWLVERTDPLDRTWSFTYDDVGNLTRVVRPDGQFTQVTYDQRSCPLVVVGPDGSRWEHGYDHHGNLTTSVDPAGATTRYVYDPGRPGHVTAVIDALGHTTKIRTGTDGQPNVVVTPSGATTRVDYGRDGRTVAVTDPVDGVSRYRWTVEGALASRAGPDGAVERWDYDGEGNLVEYVDAAGLATRYEYGHFDVPAVRHDPDGTRLVFGYDTEAHLTSVTNPQGLRWVYTYDAAGQLVRESDFDGRELTYYYDAAGQLTSRTSGTDGDARQTVTYVRDMLGATVQKNTATDTVMFVYDAAGRVVRATNAEADCVLAYDLLGRAVSETVNGRTTQSSYDVLGRRTQRVTPYGIVSDWRWDSDGNPVALRLAGQEVTFTYDAGGRETLRRLDTGLTFTKSWHAAHRLLSQTVTSPDPHRAVYRQGWTYGADGYPAAFEDTHQGSGTYTLDAARRITAVTGKNWQESYAYDAAGNLTHASWPSGHRSDSDAYADTRGSRIYRGTRIRGAGAVRYEHDSHGRVVLRQQKRLSAPPRTWRYTWDADERLSGVVTPDGQRWQYGYDPFGRRITKRLVDFDGAILDEIRYVWDGPHLAEQQRESDRHVLSWEWEPGTYRPLVQLEQRQPGQDQGPHGPEQDWYDTRFYAIVTDLVGTPALLLHQGYPQSSLCWSGAGF